MLDVWTRRDGTDRRECVSVVLVMNLSDSLLTTSPARPGNCMCTATGYWTFWRDDSQVWCALSFSYASASSQQPGASSAQYAVRSTHTHYTLAIRYTPSLTTLDSIVR